MIVYILSWTSMDYFKYGSNWLLLLIRGRKFLTVCRGYQTIAKFKFAVSLFIYFKNVSNHVEKSIKSNIYMLERNDEWMKEFSELKMYWWYKPQTYWLVFYNYGGWPCWCNEMTNGDRFLVWHTNRPWLDCGGLGTAVVVHFLHSQTNFKDLIVFWRLHEASEELDYI